MKTRMRFTKTGSMKFIGHLDCMRFFQKAIRRAKLDVAYSQGFSPHQLMSFASPLGVGVTSDGEYLDVEFHSLPDMPLPELVNYLNQFMTEEIFVTEIEIMPDGFKNSMSLLQSADYMIVEKQPEVFPKNWKEKWEQFMEQPAITVVKKTKKSEKEIDLKPHILAWSFERPEEVGTIHCEYEGETLYLSLTSGSETNIKPELVLSAFYTFCQAECRPYSYQVHRLQMHFAESGRKK
ncbi:MAG: TIGR03936 family radical SAM-associated protein [Eubacterium sp.]|nr:TIGR03936 family radical SAM-associated protein [Eubacterium sp.]